MVRPMRVKVCRSNLVRYGAGAAAVKAACVEVGATFEVASCLERCLQCEKAAIALVDGALVGADDAAALAEAIRESGKA